MIIGDWQDKKPTEPGMYHLLYGDVEVRDNLYFIDLRFNQQAENLFCGENSSKSFVGASLGFIGSGYQWAKVYLGSEAKEEVDELFPGTLKALAKINTD